MRKLYIENFGPVKNAELELRNVNLFIGQQSIGKSTIAKLITIFTDYVSLGKIIIGKQILWESQLKAYNLDNYLADDYHIKYFLEEKGVQLLLDIKPDVLESSLTKKGKKIDKDEVISELLKLRPFFHKETFLKEMIEEVSKRGKKEIEKVLLEFMSNSLYIPAERIVYSVITKLMPAITLTQSAVPQNLLRFLVDLTNAKAKYPTYDISMLNISYKQRDSEDFIVLNNNQKELPLNSASSGIQSLLPLLLVLQFAVNNREYSSFVIEEPECNLFPEKQVELLTQILSTVKSENRTLTITTHSPYLLSAMNNYLFAGTLIEKYKDDIRESIEKILSESSWLQPGECSVYSLGEDINGNEVYCKSLIDESTGMIDYNSLDTISAAMSEEFDALENAYIQMTHNNSKK